MDVSFQTPIALEAPSPCPLLPVHVEMSLLLSVQTQWQEMIWLMQQDNNFYVLSVEIQGIMHLSTMGGKTISKEEASEAGHRGPVGLCTCINSGGWWF